MLTAITGINWGDEGKGRMVDLLSQDYDIVARYQGGDNAGHTVKNERGKVYPEPDPFRYSAPGGRLRHGRRNGHRPRSIWKLRSPRCAKRALRSAPNNLKISDRATITMPFHVEQDGLEEARLSQDRRAVRLHRSAASPIPTATSS